MTPGYLNYMNDFELSTMNYRLKTTILFPH